MLEMYSAWLAPVRAKIPSNLSAEDYAALTEAISKEATSRFADFLAGIAFYQKAETTREEVGDVQTLWQEGTTRLLDYAPASTGPVVLVIPSLVNRFEILDLVSDHSFLRFLAGQGLHPLVIDWDKPGDQEKSFSFNDYARARLQPCLEKAVAIQGGKPVHVLGYCMGGLMALALAVLEETKVRSLALMAAPWDFAAHGVGGVPAAHTVMGQFFLSQAKAWLPCLEGLGLLPTEFLQAVLTGFQPLNILQKFSRYANPPADEKKQQRFVLTEDWLNNGVPLALPVARACLIDWYEKNMTATMQWTVADILIDPRKVSLPVFAAVPSKDKVVPPECAKPLVAHFSNATLIEPATGHLGLMASEDAPKNVWAPYVQWLFAQ